MKSLMTALMMLIPALSHASDATSAELLETLIANSGRIELEGFENNNASVTELIAGALANETLVAPGDYAVISNVRSSCALEGASHGGTEWSCNLHVQVGDYLKTEGGYEGPMGESSLIFTFKTIKARGEKSKHQLKGSKVRLGLAG